MDQDKQPEDVLRFWFGELDAQGMASEAISRRWWTRDDAFDLRVRGEFGETFQAAMDGRHEAWRDEPRSLLAYVIVLDQFSRNMFRNDPRAFSADPRALEAARVGVDAGLDRMLVGVARMFLYMPFEHSEDLRMQDRSVALFTAFRDESTGPLREQLDYFRTFAIRHRDVVARWGRFPHRNAVLGRTTSEEEREFLSQPGSSF